MKVKLRVPGPEKNPGYPVSRNSHSRTPRFGMSVNDYGTGDFPDFPRFNPKIRNSVSSLTKKARKLLPANLSLQMSHFSRRLICYLRLSKTIVINIYLFIVNNKKNNLKLIVSNKLNMKFGCHS